MSLRNLPPLGFALAAQELNVTRGAISQQVRLLEASLGRDLFKRGSRGVQITSHGKKYFTAVQRALKDIEAATVTMTRSGRSDLLRIRMLPAFAEKCVMPRLQEFQDKQALIKIELRADDGDVDFSEKQADMWISYSNGTHDGCTVEPLLDEFLFPACSPAFQKKHKVTRPEELLDLPLLKDTYCLDDWDIWFKSVGVNGTPKQRGDSFSLFSMVIQAAVKGMGVCMAHEALVQSELRLGTLVELFNHRVRAPASYFVVTPRKIENRQAVRQFTQWLRSEASRIRPATVTQKT
jgi:LysR family glycine cleavage system transcriptional activator